jgi:predicted ABC-type ATPase
MGRVAVKGNATDFAAGTEIGDEIYFQHASGPACGQVRSIGCHGVTVHHENKPHQVKWEHVLGHKKRAPVKYTVIDEGEDGAIVGNAAGKKKFLRIDPSARLGDMVLDKSLRGNRMILFAKANGAPPGPGLSRKQITDKNGVQVNKWVRTNPDQAKPRERAHADSAPSHVGFNHGEFKGHGKVIASGADGHTVQDGAGATHRIPHASVTHQWYGDDKPDASPHDDDETIHPDKFSAADFAKQHDDPNASAESIMAAHPPEVRERAAKTVEKLGTVKPTDQEHSQDGVWNPERAAMHRKIIFDGVEVKGKKVPGLLSNERVKAATPAPGQKPTFIALGGRGGSGKSTLNGKVYQEENAIVLDADHIKGMLPEYAGWNAHQVHEESGHILDTVLAMAKILGVNVVLDATMKTGKTLEDKINSFKDAGFRTEAHYMHLPRQEAAKRAMSRFAGGGETGRYVPPEVVLGNTENEANFDKIKNNVDAWSFHDNNRSKEEGPKLISGKGTPALVPKKIMTKAMIRPILFL